MSAPKLTFESGTFTFFTQGCAKPPRVPRGPWLRIGEFGFTTTSLRAAAAFRTFGDEKTKRIFERIFNNQMKVPKLPPLDFLDPHQVEGVKWVLSLKRAYLAHAPGAGKTGTTIVSSILAGGAGQTVFIVPPDLTTNWEREIYKFSEMMNVWPTIGVVPRTAKKDDMAWRADFIIVPDSMLTKPWVYERLRKMRIKFLAVDEASRLKESLSERSIAFYGGSNGENKYPGLYRDIPHVVFLDGSPMPNRPIELWAPTYALDPEAIDCMSMDDFGYRYCGAQVNDRGVWEYKHASNEWELKERLKKFMHVVPESRLDHPERRRSMLFMNEDVRSEEHKSWERKHLTGLGELDEEKSQGQVAHFRKELGLRKAAWIARYISNRLETKNESILLFVWHREVAQNIYDELKRFRPALIIGGVDSGVRERAFESFQKGKTKLIIGNIAAMGRGHNLQRADRAIFGEFSWSDELNKQCEKRASRRGRDVQNFVRCEYIVSPGSMDETVLNSVFTKERRVRKVIGG